MRNYQPRLEQLEDRTTPVLIVGDLPLPPVPPLPPPVIVPPDVPDLQPLPPPVGLAQVDVRCFIDYNADGIFQPEQGEIGLENVLVGLATLDAAYQTFLTTNADGLGWFTDAPAGTVYASAMVPPDYSLTTPATVAVQLNQDQIELVMFGFVALFD